MLFQTPSLSEIELDVIERIQNVRESLRYAVDSSVKRWTGLIRRTTLARAIRGSNSIEGYNVTIDDAIAAAAGEEPLTADEATWAAVVGYRSALTYVLQLADDPFFGHSTDLIRSLHFMMMQHDLTKNPGKWRPGPIYVRDEARNIIVYEGPDAENVSGLMAELIQSLTQDRSTPAMVRAAMAHLNLVMIHPFSDGNGRMARCLQTLVLARTGTRDPIFSSIEEYLGRNTQAYYDVLADVGQGAWHPDRDARPWVRFCLTAHFRQATTLVRRTRTIKRLWDEAEAITRRLNLPERTVLAMTEAAAGFRVRNSTYRDLAEVSDQIASRDFKSLVDAGLLIPNGEKRGRYYTASPELQAIFVRVAGDQRSPIADPFEAESDETLFLPGLENAAF